MSNWLLWWPAFLFEDLVVFNRVDNPPKGRLGKSVGVEKLNLVQPREVWRDLNCIWKVNCKFIAWAGPVPSFRNVPFRWITTLNAKQDLQSIFCYFFFVGAGGKQWINMECLSDFFVDCWQHHLFVCLPRHGEKRNKNNRRLQKLSTMEWRGVVKMKMALNNQKKMEHNGLDRFGPRNIRIWTELLRSNLNLFWFSLEPFSSV